MPLNGLAGASSPYLLQHATNPVDWLIWSEEALARAKEEDKPILLSVGYAACHWCHVMAHESFEDREIAAVMNEHFISIKVDREERPDLDSIYMNALSAMGEQGGWPLTMFLTPEGTPFFGGTYFPPESRWGRPGFRQVLEAIARAWQEEREKIATGSAALFRRLESRNTAPVGEAPEPADLTAVTDRYLQAIDWQDGGLGGAPKFPNVPIFRFLWSEHVRTGRHEAGAAVGLMLGRMAQGGIYDHLGGGFARYSTDAEWLVPHFEKMLYDNALLLELIALAYAVEPDPLLAARAVETVEWLLREMRAEEDRDPEGRCAFAASLDADSEGEEGKFYVWTRAELDAALGDDFPRFAEHYPCPEAGNWEGKIILTRPERPESIEVERDLATLRARLLALRDQRVRPGRDDKILADWNGMAIAALARAAGIFGRSDWLAAACEAYDAVGAMLRAEDGRYDHAYRRGQVSAAGLLDDQAAMLGATLALYEATGEAALLEDASRLAAATDRHFGDTRGGFHLSADDATDLPGGFRPHGDTDGPTPSGAGMMAEARARLWHLTGDETHRQRAREIVATVTGERRALPAFPTMLVAAALLEEAQTVVISGDPADPAFTALHAAALAHVDPLTAILPVGDTAGLPASHPAHGKRADRPAAFVCRGATCGLPVVTAEDLVASLRRPATT